MTVAGRGAALIRHRRGTVALEFAIVANVLVLLLTGAIGAGLLWWTANGLQTAAALTARCAALGSCADAQSFAVATAGDWTFAGIITAGDVTAVTGPACNSSGTPQQFVTITIVAPFWAGVPLPAALSNISLSVSSCFPIPS